MSIADWRMICGNLSADKFRLVCNSHTDFYIYAKTTDSWDKYMFEVLSESRENISTYSPIFKFNSSSTPISGDPNGTSPRGAEQITFDMVYPIGSIYMSVNSTNPKNLFGGIWVSWGSGRVPVGVNTSDSSFNTVEKTGGDKNHRHEFRIGMHWWYGHAGGEGAPNTTGAYRFSDSQYDGWARETTAMDVIVNSNATTGTKTQSAHGKWSKGDTSNTSTLQPYITCYMWKRTG